MNEAILKRALMRSLKAQCGQGFRIEDKYRIGVPDMLMKPLESPGFLIEAKILKGAKLVCTPAQQRYIEMFFDPPFFYSALVGYSDRHRALYIGWPETPLSACRFVPRPNRLDSGDWWITELLTKWRMDNPVLRGVGEITTLEVTDAPAIPRFRRRPTHESRLPALHPHADAPPQKPTPPKRDGNE